MRPARPIRARLLAAGAATGLLVALLPAVAAPTLAAQSITVCASGCAYSTIQAALNSASSGDTIVIAAGTYTQTDTTDQQITVDTNLTLEGAGANQTVIAESRVNVDAGATVTLSSLSVTGNYGSSYGGIYNDGTLTLKNVTVRDVSLSEDGPGIYNGNGATLTLEGTTVRHNTATGLDGGGIYNDGAATLKNSTVSDNTASQGGGIYNARGGTVTLQDSTVGGNSAANGGGILNGGHLTVTDSTVSGNEATDNSGAGIDNIAGTVTLKGSTISDNIASGENSGGGGLYNFSGTMTLTDTTVSGNQADLGGGVYMMCEFGGSHCASLTLKNSAVTGNTANQDGGGVYVSYYSGTPYVSLKDSTVTGNNPDNCEGTSAC